MLPSRFKLHSLTLALILCLFSKTIAQPVNNYAKDVSMPAPNAAALGKYGDYSVGNFTGVPDISIPIYTVQEGSLSLPIGLSYHASGLKVAEMASWVGAGWSLNAGGIITRTVQGIRDEAYPGGYFYKAAYLETRVNQAGSDPALNSILNNEIASSEIDGEPDMFSFNVSGYTGKFYIDKNHEVQTIPKQDIKIEIDSDLSGEGFLGFTIIPPDGTRYIFGRTQLPDASWNEAYEKTKQQDQGPQDPVEKYITSWYIVKIETADKKYSIAFTYDNEAYSYLNAASGKYTFQSACGQSQATETFSYNSLMGSYHHVFRTNVEGKKISQIKTTTTEVNFISTNVRTDLDYYYYATPYWNNYAKSLDKIEIKTGDRCQKFDFLYTYFQDNITPLSNPGIAPSVAKKLKLESLIQKSCDDTTIVNPPYTFTYEGNFLPHRMHKGIDHWGYYNGATSNETNTFNFPPTTVTIPGTTQPFNQGSSNRETNETEMKKGVLTDITFPTGGKTTFTYEANTVPATVQSAPIPVFNIANCSSPYNSACCGFINTSGNYTITPEDLNSGKFKLTLVKPIVPTSPPSDLCYNNYNISSYIYVYDHTTWAYMGSYGFSLNPGQSNYDITLPLNTLGNLQAGIEYYFHLAVDNGYSTFQITNQPWTPINKKIGGLRIKEIRTNDGVSAANDIVKQYDYSIPNSPNSTSGKLLRQPTYGLYYLNLYLTGLNVNPSSATVVMFNDETVVPLYTFEGNHIGYEYVKEIETNNGSRLYKYNVEIPTPSYASYNTGNSIYPFPPLNPIPSNGQLSVENVYSQNGLLLKKKENFKLFESPTYNIGKIRKVIKLPFTCEGTNFQTTLYGRMYNDYHIKTLPYRLQYVTETMDNMPTTTTYTYSTDPAQPLFPLTISMENSDGKTTVTHHKYITDPSVTSPAKAEMINRNIIANPVETTEKVANVTTNGSKTVFDLFNGNPYPKEFWKYKMSWDANGTAQVQGWEKEGTINSYNANGQPTSFTQRGWEANPETYTWNATNGLIETRTFKDFVWRYDYFPNTRLVQKITNIDGQFTTFTYDHFKRMKTSSARGGAVTTENTYKYQDAANANKNWIETKITFSVAIGGPLSNNTTYKTVRQYFDGLGRPIQSVAVANSPNQKDVVSAVAYDNQGREAFKYEPYETTFSNGSFVAPTGQFTKLDYEASPLNRIWKVTPPNWLPTITEYGTNAAGEAYDMTGNATYPANTLNKVTVTDPDGRVSKSYTDRKGRKTFTVQTQNNVVGGSYMIYQFDDKDRLVKAFAQRNTWQEWVYAPDLDFRYVYDVNDNMTQKFIPDAARIDMVYNVRNQLVLMQDGNLRAQYRFLATQYDDYGRPIATGYNLGDDGASTGGNPGLTGIYTTTEYGTTAGVELGKVKRTKNYQGNYLETVLQYDNFGRLQYSYGNSHINPMSGAISATNFSEKIELTYDLADNVLSKIRTHKPNSTITNVITETTDYDNGLRPKQIKHKIDALPEQILSYMNYTIKNQVATKWVGKPTLSSLNYLQKVDYSYNTLGWLTGINSPATAMGLGLARPLAYCDFPVAFAANPTDLDKNDLFSMDLKYENPNAAFAPSGTTATPQYGGNISQIVWQVRGRERQAYTFQYDHLSRMTSAAYSDISTAGTVTGNRFDEKVTYDVRGNINTLQRWGLNSSCQWGLIDNLTYKYGNPSYNPKNQLQSITDASDLARGFKTMANGSTYTYDVNGNLKTDPNKGITNITYNYLNLPLVITFTGGNSITFMYDAAGNKLRKTVSGSVNYVQDYVEGIEYRTVSGVKTLEAIHHTEGRVTNINGSLKYEYALKDHLGNTRLMFSDKNGNGLIEQSTAQETSEVTQENHYYSFGLLMEGVWANTLSVTDSRYTYNGKELNSDFGLEWTDYGARFYDAAIGRWHVIDPMADFRLSLSPYQYVQNNPVNRIDLFGMLDVEGGGGGGKKDNVLPEVVVTAQRSKASPSWKAFIGQWSNDDFQAFRNGPATDYVRRENTQVKTQPGIEGVEVSDIIEDNESIATEDEAMGLLKEWWAQENSAVLGLSYLSTKAETVSSSEEAIPVLAKATALVALGWTGIKLHSATLAPIVNLKNIVKNPTILYEKGSYTVGNGLGAGWTKGSYGKSGIGWKFTDGKGNSVFTHRGGRHKGSYWGFSTGKTGKVKVVGKDYLPLPGDKATIIKK